MAILATALVFLAVLSGGSYFVLSRTGPVREARELAARIGRPQVVESEEILRPASRPPERIFAFGMRWVYRLDLMQKLEENLWQAGIYMRVSDVLLVMLLLFGAGATIGAALWQDAIFALGLGGAFAVLPIIYVRIRRARRLKQFVRQLPFALDLMKSSLEAGHSLLRGLQVVVSEFQDPIATEFRSVIEQTRLGLPLPRAMEEMLKRVPEEDLQLLVVAIRVQSEVGSSLAQIIGRLSDIVRTRQRLQGQIRALTAQARLSGWVVGFLPVVILAVYSLVQPSYTATLFHDPTGVKILKIAAGLDILAFLTIRKLLRVRF
jgi:tight adherence protein B